MKRIIIFLAVFSLCAGRELRAQDAAVEERLNKLNGYVQDLLEDKATQKKQIESLAKDIQSLRDQQSQPNTTYATQEDLRKVAQQLQEIDKKREADKELILKEIEKLGKTVASPAAVKKTKPITEPVDKAGPAGATPEKGYDYTIQPNDTLLAVAKAYKDQGIKVTVDQILKANPGLDPTKLKVGQKIFIPAPQP